MRTRKLIVVVKTVFLTILLLFRNASERAMAWIVYKDLR